MTRLTIVSNNEKLGPDLNEKVVARLCAMIEELYTIVASNIAIPVQAAVALEESMTQIGRAADHIAAHAVMLDGSAPQARKEVKAAKGRY